MNLLIYLLLLCLTVSLIHSKSSYEKLLVVSFDGFRFDYLDLYREVTPVLNELKSSSSYAKCLINVFPTQTFPNHFSIATGVYSGVHGVLGSNVFDKDANSVLKDDYELFHYNKDITPIWTLNEKAGSGRHSGVMWPGCAFSYGNTNSTFSNKFDASVPFRDRVERAMSWFTHPTTPANLVMMYFEEPDKGTHAFGPNSPESRAQVRRVDDITQYILDSLKNNDLMDVNVVLLSDHGMEGVTRQRIIDLRPIVEEICDMYGTSPVLQVYPREDRVERAMSWFTHPTTPANLVMMYFEEPDKGTHAFGPNSPESRAQVRRVDDITQYILDSLKNNDLMDVNVVLLSDHGMEGVTRQRIIDLRPIVEEICDMYGTSPVLQVYPREDRVERAMSWFTHPTTPANLVMMYFEEPDKGTHAFGPNSPESRAQVRRVDDITQYILDSLKNNDLMDVNVVLLSDHGMEGVTRQRIIDLRPIVEEICDMYGTSPVLQVYPREDSRIGEVYGKLKVYSLENGHFKVYLKSEIPEHFQIKKCRRTPPILALADPPYAFHDLYDRIDRYVKYRNASSNGTYGVHGYDPNTVSMHPYFIAHGPAFKKNFNAGELRTVDMYSLFSHLLNLEEPKAVKVNGTFSRVSSLLKPSFEETSIMHSLDTFLEWFSKLPWIF